MRIVIITAIPFWHPGTMELIQKMRERGFNITAIDILNGRILNEDNSITFLVPRFPFLIAEKVYRKIFRKSWINRYIHSGDIVDMHFVEPSYGKYIVDIKNKGTKVISTLFGSDLFRTSIEIKKQQSIIFRTSDAIIMSKNMVPYFDTHFPGLESRIIYNQYGSLRLDLIAEMDTDQNRHTYRRKYNIEDDRVVVTCGYNGKKEQQHLALIKAITQLPEAQKSRLFLIFPVTYGNTEEYDVILKQEISLIKIPFLWLDKRMTDKELAETKIISDITINAQTTDALASSIKEAFAAKNVLLVGDWLPYETYGELGIHYHKSSLENFTDELSNIIQSLDAEKALCETNVQKVLKFASWNYLIEDWIKLYTELDTRNNGGK